jgi:hypothetical protein
METDSSDEGEGFKELEDDELLASLWLQGTQEAEKLKIITAYKKLQHDISEHKWKLNQTEHLDIMGTQQGQNRGVKKLLKIRVKLMQRQEQHKFHFISVKVLSIQLRFCH